MDPDTVDMEVAINLISGISAEDAELRPHPPLLNILSTTLNLFLSM